MTETLTPIEPGREIVPVVASSFVARLVSPLAVDDVTLDLGDREYTAMRRDAIIAANLNLYTSAVLADDPIVTPVVNDKTDARYEQSAALATWVADQIEDMETPIFDALRSMLDAIAYGCKIAEIIYRADATYTGRQQFVLDKIKPKPRYAALLGLDPFNNVRGVYANGLVNEEGMARWRMQLMPREHFLIYSYRPQDADPRGTSLLRPAYTAWDVKQKLWPEYFRFLAQFATPSILATLPENAKDELDVSGQRVPAAIALLTKLLDIQNGSAAVLPHGAQTELLFSQGEGAAFLSAFDMLNREMTTAMLSATRATMEAQNGSKADSETATDVVEIFIRQTRLGLERALRQQVLMPLVELNYGPAARRLAPYISLGGVRREDAVALSGAIAALARESLIFPSQLPEIHRLLNLPQATAEEYVAAGATPAQEAA